MTAAKLGEKDINADYSCGGLEPGATRAMLVCGVDKLSGAAKLPGDLAAEEA
jgi:hypothetical protein